MCFSFKLIVKTEERAVKSFQKCFKISCISFAFRYNWLGRVVGPSCPVLAGLQTTHIHDSPFLPSHNIQLPLKSTATSWEVIAWYLCVWYLNQMEAVKYKAQPLFFLTQKWDYLGQGKSFLPTKVLVSYIMTYINNIKTQSYIVTLMTLFHWLYSSVSPIKLQDAFKVIQLDLIELKLLLNSAKGKSV